MRLIRIFRVRIELDPNKRPAPEPEPEPEPEPYKALDVTIWFSYKELMFTLFTQIVYYI